MWAHKPSSQRIRRWYKLRSVYSRSNASLTAFFRDSSGHKSKAGSPRHLRGVRDMGTPVPRRHRARGAPWLAPAIGLSTFQEFRFGGCKTSIAAAVSSDVLLPGAAIRGKLFGALVASRRDARLLVLLYLLVSA